jgi:hypothetical protein
MSYVATIWVILAATALLWAITQDTLSVLIGIGIGAAVLLMKATVEAVIPMKEGEQ